MSEPRQASEALRGLLRELGGHIPVERIDRVWLFRPREIAGKESGLVVLSLRPDEGRAAEQRQVVTWRYQAERVRGRWRRSDEMAEQGWAPAERIPRLIEGVLARLADESENPYSESIEGSEERWTALLRSIGVSPDDPAVQ